jgi:ferredoxin-NADP reductase
MKEYLTKVTQVRHLTLEVSEFTVRLIAPGEIKFQAGQVMEIQRQGRFQPYFIASPPTGPNSQQLVFCIQGWDIQRGEELIMRGPTGGFIVQNFQYPLFFIATNAGVAPFASIIPDLLVRGFVFPLRLLFGARSEENIFYYDRFNRLQNQYENFKFVPILSRPQSHWPGQIGQITTYLEVNYPFYKDYTYYVCDKKPVVAEVVETLQRLGHPSERIKAEVLA